MTEKQEASSIAPKNWIITQLEQVSEINSGGNAPQGKRFFARGMFPFVRVRHFDGEKNYVEDWNLITREAVETYHLRRFPKETIIFPKSGASINLEKRAILPVDAYVVSHLCAIIANPSVIDNKYLFYFLKGKKLAKDQSGSILPYFNLSYISKVDIPLAPLPEQRRIVTKLEELFTRLDAGVASLQNVKAQLQLYRQAVLKHAFNGKLTQEWRKTHKNTIQPAKVVLSQLKKEEKGLKGRYAPVSIDSSKMNELPDTWVWTSIGQVSNMIQYGTSEKASNEASGIPVLRMGNIQDGILVYDSLKYYSPEWESRTNYLLTDGDILFNRTNSPELVGKTAVYKKNHPKSVFASYLIRIKVNEEVCLPDILSSYINSVFGRKYISSVVSQQVGQANVNGRKLSAMPFPLIPLHEQEKIVGLIEEINSTIEQTQKTVEKNLEMLEKLRQSVLKNAFEGKLVAQDCTDEPAEKLLKQIRQEKEEQTKQKKVKRRKTSKRS